MLKGQIVRFRLVFATMFMWFPSQAAPFIFLRATLWTIAGWPIVGLYSTAIYVRKLIILGANMDTRLLLGGLLLSFFSPAIGDILRRIGSPIAGVSEKFKAALAMVLLGVTLSPLLFLAYMISVLNTANGGDWSIELRLLLFIPVFAGVDMLMSVFVKEYFFWRAACDFRRKFPRVYGVMASKSSRIQGAHSGGESTEVRSQGSRPILDHPAMWWWPTIDDQYYEWVIFAPPGRTMPSLDEVRDEISAQYPFINDDHDSVLLTWKNRSKFASSGLLTVKFEWPDWRQRILGLSASVSEGSLWNGLRNSRNSESTTSMSTSTARELPST